MKSFDNAVRSNIFERELKSEMSDYYKSHSGSYLMCPRTLDIKLSYDRIPEFIRVFKGFEKDFIYPISIELYDEKVIDNFELRIEFLELLNQLPIVDAKFYLCDDNFFVYNCLMQKVGCHFMDNSIMILTIDNHPLSLTAKNKMYIEEAVSKLDIPEEKLILFTNKSLEKAKHKLPSNDAIDAIKLKEVIKDYYSKMDQLYDLDKASSYELTYLAYDFIKNNITFPSKYIHLTEEGKEVLLPNAPEYIAKAYGTFLNREGVCSGQAKLMSALLSNKYANIDTTTLLGDHPLGKHKWVGIVIDDYMFECCTTISGPFKDLRSLDYIIDEREPYPKAYSRAYLSDKDIETIKSNVMRLRRK